MDKINFGEAGFMFLTAVVLGLLSNLIQHSLRSSNRRIKHYNQAARLFDAHEEALRIVIEHPRVPDTVKIQTLAMCNRMLDERMFDSAFAHFLTARPAHVPMSLAERTIAAIQDDKLLAAYDTLRGSLVTGMLFCSPKLYSFISDFAADMSAGRNPANRVSDMSSDDSVGANWPNEVVPA